MTNEEMNQEENISDAAKDAIEQAQSTGKDLAPNSNELLDKYYKEVQEEFRTSKEGVYKEALRSLIKQRDQLIKQLDTIRTDLETLDRVKKALDAEFLAGKLISHEDSKKVTKKVMLQIQQERDS